MRTTWTLALASSGLGLTLLASTGCGRAEAAGAAATAGGNPVDLTVYKDDFALVHEKRPVKLPSGASQVRLSNVSRSLDPNTVTFDPPEGTEVVATTYDLGVSSGGGLIQRLAGKNVELIWSSDDGHEGDRLKGFLEPTPDGGFLIRSGDHIYINPKGTLVAPADSEVATMPGLSVQLTSDRGTDRDLGMSYLTRGMSWSADYVAHLDPVTSTLKLECWASVTNGTGIPYRNAKITFVAGSPNRAVRQPEAQLRDGAFAAEARAKSDMAEKTRVYAPQAVGELYEYEATGPATIGVDQMSRVRMIEAKAVPVRRDYNIRLDALSPWINVGRQNRVGAQLALKFENRDISGLGMPLPGGGIRVFESDGKTERYTGADTIADVPKDAPIELTLTKVFDVYAEPTIVKSQKIDKHTIRKTIRIAVHNAKASSVEVRLVQDIYTSGWKYIGGEKPEYLSANTLQWKVGIPAEADRTIEATFDLKV